MQRGSASLSYLVLFPRNIRLLPRAIFHHFKGFNIGLAGRGSKSMVSQMLQNSTKIIFVQQKYLFNFDQNYFHSIIDNNNSSTSTMHCQLITNRFLWQRFWKFPDLQNIVFHKLPVRSLAKSAVLPIQSSKDNFYAIKMASEEPNREWCWTWIQVVEFRNIWLTINVGLSDFLTLDAGYKYNDETGIRSLYEIRNRTATMWTQPCGIAAGCGIQTDPSFRAR